MKKKFRKKSNINRVISIVLAMAMIMSGFPTDFFANFAGVNTKVMAANADNGGSFSDLTENWYVATDKTANIQTMADLVRYSQAYYSHADKHYQDTITLAITGSNEELTNFYGLGTDSYPFEGTIIIYSGSNFDYRLPEAFFDHVSDKATIIDENSNTATLKISRIGGDNSGEPIFAKHVHSSNNTEGTPVNWKVQIEPYGEDVEGEIINRNYNYAGIIGELQAGANVKLDVTDNSSANIYANGVTGDVGYICGSIKSNAKLTVNSVTGSNTSYSITTSNGNAGGIVGSMENGSTLTLGYQMLNTAPAVSTSATSKYAGGLVGSNDGGTVTYTTTKPYAVGGTLSGKAGAGGLFGYFRPVYTETEANSGIFNYTYDISDYTISTTVNGNGSVGGLFGVFDNKRYVSESEGTVSYGDGNVIITSTDNNKRTVSITHTSGDVDNIGGYIGYYKSNSMASTLKFDNVTASVTKSNGKHGYGYGGGIGRINSTSYVLFDGFTLSAATNPNSDGVFGGLVGDVGDSFIDTNATSGRTISITSDSYKGGGIVGRFNDGVLRLRGTTNISGTTCADGGQIVGERDDTLVFAENGWTLARKGTPDEYDDIGSWGEVIRFGTDLTQSSVLTVGSDNLITIAAPVTTIDSEEDFAIDSICFSIKAGRANNDGNPWLKYATGATLNHTNIVTTDLELGADINLQKTGLTGLTRDSGTDKVTYSATFNGNGHTLTLAIGDTSTGFNGKIYRHDKNGLFGILSSRTVTSGEGESATTSIVGGTIESLNLAGTVNVKAHSDMCVGAAAAQATGDFTATDVSVSATFTHGGSKTIYMGRLLGEATDSIGAIAITNPTESNGSHTYGKYTGNLTGDNSAVGSCLGGVIGRISHSKAEVRSWTISNVESSGQISNTSSKTYQMIGGLIAYINNTGNNTSSNKRTLNLTGISIKNLTVAESGTTAAGGVLGYAWRNTDVNLNGVTVTSSSVSLTGGADLAGAVYNATGKWTIPSGGLNMDGLTVTAANAGSFGMIINKGWYLPDNEIDFFTSGKSSAIYLLLTATDSFDCNGATLTGLKSDIVFDELVAFSAYYGDDNGTKVSDDDSGDPYILKNGNGVVSIKTTDATLNMSGNTTSKSYVAQTSRGSYTNKWTRYYYNLDTVTSNTASSLTTPQTKLMSWGLNQYAHKSIRSNFANPFGNNNEFTLYNGDTSATSYSMAGYSWYPVDVDSKTVKVQGAFEFFNAEFETCEAAKTSGSVKSSLSKTQHYLMHEGLFRNVSNSTITLGNTTWRGTINRLTTPYIADSGDSAEYGTGALIFGTFKGSKASTSIIDSSNGNIVLDGIRVSNVGSNNYAPLLINKVGDYTNLKIYHVSVKNTAAENANPTSRYKTITGADNAATSLIGDAGLSDTASNINFAFSDVKLDGRSGSTPAGLDLVYPTSHSIFTKATLLNRFRYASDSDAVYNYAITEDWSAGDHVGNVTYGSELSDNTTRNQWYGYEHWYNGQNHETGYLTSPESDSLTGGASSAYNFSGFRPYVNIVDTKSGSNTILNHQIRVNHESSELSGCGTYNDPYLVSGSEFEMIARILAGTGEGTINLPIVANDNATTLLATKWDSNDHKAYQWNGTDKYSTFTTTNGVTTYNNDGYSLETVRKYLAGAYYKLDADITLSSGFVGLGATGDSYAVFRGVIIGGGTGKNTITNESNYPFIVSSYGSVVKNLNIVVSNTNISKTSVTSITTYSESQSNEAYGAVIGQIFGGDNIIDNVKVQFNETTVDAGTGEKTVTQTGKITVGGSYPYLLPVGGYVGVVVNGALIFRGMEEYRSLDDDLNITGLTNANVTDDSNANNMIDSTKYLYVNPIVGRVLNGYVMTETTTYRPYETGTRTFPDNSTDSVGGAVTMKNGTKNYSIPDISNSDTSSITVGSYTTTTGSYKKTKVTLLNGQAVFLFGALIQSKTTQSTPGDTVTLSSSVSYGSYKTTHVGTYERIGEQNTAATAAPASGHPYNGAINDGWGTSAKPYVAGKYTSGGVLAVTNSNSICNIQLGADSTPATSSSSPFRVPDGFKGLGSYLTNDNFISLFGLDGQGNTLSLGMSLQYYKGNVENKTAIAHYNTGYTTIDNYCPPYNSGKPDYAGFGFFNFLRQNRDGTGFSKADSSAQYQIHDLVISGKVYAEVYNTSGNNLGYDYADNSETKSDTYRNKDLGIVSVGGLAGVAGNGQNDTISIKGVQLNNLSVFSPKTAGGLIGHLCNQTGDKYKYLYNCSAEKLVVSAGQEAGGLVGVIEGKNCTIDGKVGIDSNSVIAPYSVDIVSTKTGGSSNNIVDNGYSTWKNRSYYAGGLVGRSEVNISIQNTNIGVLDSSYSGFIGNSNRSADTLNEESANGVAYVGYMMKGTAKYVYYCPQKPWSIVGGIIGATSYTGNAPTVRNCNVYNISMYGGFAGGITARPEGAANIYNCNVSSTQTAAEMEAAETTTGKSKYMITAWYGAAGLSGEPRATNTIDGCTVSNYVIRCYSEDNNGNLAHAGGLIGRSNNNPVYVRNCSVINCYIEGRGKSSGDSDRNEGIGGIIGINNQGINGYNILVKDIKLLANNTAAMDTSSSTPFAYKEINTSDNRLQNGYAAGAVSDGKTVKIVGFALKITDSNNTTITDPWYASAKPDEANSYFINADYNCACDDEDTRSLEFSNITLANADPKNNVKDFVNDVTMTDNKPYVTSSPYKYINATQFLTGDGIYGSGYNDSIAKQIVTDAIGDKPIGYYQDIKLSFPYSISKESPGSYALDSKPSGEALTAMMAAFPDLYKDENGPLAEGDYPTYGNIYLNELQSKLTTFQAATDYGTSVPRNYDFPVLVLDDSNRYATTELLNNYIKVLTNTDYNYATTSSDYVVRFGKCTYQTSGANAGTFSVTWSNDSTNSSNLKITDNYFKLSGNYDNEVAAGQFTLVDVQFKIPESVTKVVSSSDYSRNNYIAYHLYIPVLVKKMLNYDFECSVLSGTSYRVKPYEEAPRNNVLIENLETPVTLQFSWVYRRTLDEWVSQIEGGENLLQYFDNKKLTVNDHNRSSYNVSGLGFPDADMVLVDANNYNKPYYATKSMAYSAGVLNLASFTTDGTGSGTAYSPVQFINFFDISVSTTETTGDNVVKCKSLGSSTTGATLKVGNTYYRPYADNDSGDASYLTFNYKEGMYNTYGEGEDAYSYLKEDYYISFFTKKATGLEEGQEDTSVYHLVFSAPQTLGSAMPNKSNTLGSTDLFLGDIYSNTFSMMESSPTDYELTTASTSIGATFYADIELSSNSKNLVKGYLGNSSVKIFQSFLVNFEKTELENNALNSEKGVKSQPTVTISKYIIDTENVSGLGIAGDGETDGGVDVTSAVNNDDVCKISVENGTLTSNYIELRNNQNLANYLKNANGTIRIKAEFSLDYAGENEADTKKKISDQFPLRDETTTLPAGIEYDDIGTIIIGSSGISASNIATAYSKASDGKDGTVMYYTGLKAGVAMSYESDDAANINGTYAQLGINSWNSTDAELPMKTLITYNVSNVEKADTATRLDLTLTLYRKDNYEGSALPLGQYLKKSALVVKGKNSSNIEMTTDNTTSYVYQISAPMSSLDYDEDTMTYSIPIDFSVFTGANDGFEKAKDGENQPFKYYSNYMVKAEVVLYNGDTRNGSSYADDHVIYSNAKIITDWVSPD